MLDGSYHFFFQVKPLPARVKYRTYSPTTLTNAYLAVKEGGSSVRKASKQFCIPMQTLRDRTSGRIDPDCVTTGRPPMFSSEEEVKIVEHLKAVSSYGYGYTRSEVALIASDYAVQLNKRSTTDPPLTRRWLDGFFQRWPELKVLRPRALEFVRAKSASEEVVMKYFENLSETVNKYDLHDKPHLIFNIDEKGISPNHTPPSIVGHRDFQPPAVTTGKSATTTVIGSGSASGVAIPPYFVFAGKRWNDDLLKGGSPGVGGTVSETGWSNSDIFRTYLEDHFLKYVPVHDQHPLLILLDGHSTHVSIGLVEWARARNIILFILPAHCSHILQPLDVACFGPFQRIFNNEIHKQLRTSSCVITRYNLCEIASKVYSLALCAENLRSGFRKTGIFPLDSSVVDKHHFLPAEILRSTPPEPENDIHMNSDPDAQPGITEPSHAPEVLVPSDPSVPSDKNEISSPEKENFFDMKLNSIRQVKSENKKRKRKSVSKITSGKPITEAPVFDLIREYESGKKISQPKKKITTEKDQQIRKPKNKMSQPNKSKKQASPQAGPSHINIDSDSDLLSTDESEIDETEKCCVCSKYTPDQVRNSLDIKFTKWVQCANTECKHWVHLIYCTPLRAVRRDTVFYCTHCPEDPPEE